jgi:hypothetical protein
MRCGPFPDLHPTVEDLIAEGDKVVARPTIRGAHQGEYLGLPPTGKQVAFAAIAIFRVADGKIAESWILRDELSILQQLGHWSSLASCSPATGSAAAGQTRYPMRLKIRCDRLAVYGRICAAQSPRSAAAFQASLFGISAASSS